MTLIQILTIIYVVSVPLSAIEVSIQKDGEDWGWKGFGCVLCPILNTIYALILVFRILVHIIDEIDF